MASKVTIAASLSGTIEGGLTASIPAITNVSYDLAATPEVDGSHTTMSTSYADINFDEVSWSDVTWAMFKNLSNTNGEIITIAVMPVVVAGLTKDADTAGASVPATLTAGHYTVISSNGTSQGKNWEAGDLAIYLGASGTYAQIRPGPVGTLAHGKTFGPVCIAANGASWKFKSATGTPRLAHAVVGALA